MMWEKLRDKIVGEKRVCGLEVKLGSDSGLLFYGIILERTDSNVSVLKTIPETENWKELVNSIPSGIPCVLTVAGRGILQKKIKDKAQFDQQKLVNSILPTVNPADFYWQLDLAEDVEELTVIKKEVLDSILERLSQLRLAVQGVHLGYSPILGFPGIFPKAVQELQTPSYTVKLEDGTVKDVKAETLPEREIEASVLVGETELPSYCILSYCAALNYFLNGPTAQPGISNAILAAEFENQQYKQKFKLATAGLLVGTLFILLVNFVAFDHYYTKSTEAQSSSLSNSEMNEKYQKAKKLATDKEAFFQKSGWLKGYRISLISDQIAGSVPDSVSLTGLTIFPVLEHNSGFKTNYQFSRDTVVTTGMCSRPDVLNAWISELKKLDRFAQVKLASYQYNNRTASAEFQIQAILK